MEQTKRRSIRSSHGKPPGLEPNTVHAINPEPWNPSQEDHMRDLGILPGHQVTYQALAVMISRVQDFRFVVQSLAVGSEF